MNGVEQKNHRTALLELRAEMTEFAESVETKFQAMRTRLEADLAASRAASDRAVSAARRQMDVSDGALREGVARLEGVCYRRLWGRLKVLLFGDGVPSR